jgi:phosphoglycolate phosphatase
MAYDLAMFDFDGTLADTFPWAVSLYEELSEQFDLPRVDPSDYERIRGLSVREMMFEFDISPRRLPAIGTFVKREMRRNLDKLTLFAGVREALRELSGHGVRLAVVSSNDEPTIRAVLGPHTAASFDHYECGVSVFGKARKLRRTLRKTHTPAPTAIYIGDEIRDLEAAYEAGLDFGAVTWGYNTRDSLAARSPTLLFDSPAEFARKLTNHTP